MPGRAPIGRDRAVERLADRDHPIDLAARLERPVVGPANVERHALDRREGAVEDRRRAAAAEEAVDEEVTERRVEVDDALLAGLADWLKEENVKVIYQ